MGLLPLADRREQERATGGRDVILYPDADRRRQDGALGDSAILSPEPTPTECQLEQYSVRHRRAAVALGRSPELGTMVDRAAVFSTAQHLLNDRERWLPAMGYLVLENTVFDVMAAQKPDDIRDFE